ncbi:MAG: c-type cytochrome [Neomegalonema sp.]|nr:c-type cytochrome [Neomegalonema sp.]
MSARPLRVALVAPIILSLGLAGCGDDKPTGPPKLPKEAFNIDHAAEVAALSGDAVRGAALFRPCMSCHRIDEPQHRTGPHLLGLFGRQAGLGKSYPYSSASRKSGVIWRVETLSAYLAAPRKYMPGTKMNYPGVKAADMADLLTFLYEKGGLAPVPSGDAPKEK